MKKVLFLFLLTMLAVTKLSSPKRSFAQNPSTSGIFALPVGSVNVSSVTEAEYKDLLEKFSRKYFLDVYQKTGRPLVIPYEWDNPYFAAFAKNQGPLLNISLWGGMVRAPGANKLILVTLLCHELGHFIGGEPKQHISGAEWASTEGQSDFYAASVCLPDFVKSHPEFLTVISPEVVQRCGTYDNCKVVLQAGLDTVRFLQRYSFRNFVPVSLGTREKATSVLVRDSYPTDQCRLDTFVAAASCHSGGECLPPRCWLPQH